MEDNDRDEDLLQRERDQSIFNEEGEKEWTDQEQQIIEEKLRSEGNNIGTIQTPKNQYERVGVPSFAQTN